MSLRCINEKKPVSTAEKAFSPQIVVNNIVLQNAVIALITSEKKQNTYFILSPAGVSSFQKVNGHIGSGLQNPINSKNDTVAKFASTGHTSADIKRK